MDQSASLSTSMTLLQRVRQQDPDAWRDFARLYGPLVYRWVRSSGISSHDASDVVQNIFVLLLRKLDRFSGEEPGSSFRGWLWTISRNAVLEYRRRHASHPQAPGGSTAHQRLQQHAATDLPEELPDPLKVRLSLAHRALKLVRAQVDESTWDAFWRSAVLGNSSNEIAADLGMTPQAVRQAKYRVLCRVRELLMDR